VAASNLKPLPKSARRDGLDAPTGPTQAEILRGAAAGERWAHAALYDALYPFVARALQKILHRTPDYEDLVQTSFELIVRTLQEPRAEKIENLAAWASAIASRVALDSLRARIRERRFFDRATNDAQALQVVARPKLEHQLDVRGELARLQAALAAMNPDQAEAVLLHDVLGHDLWEVARLTHVSPAAAQKRLSRGHAELRRRVARFGRAGER
jgi:RNA polymerase sigma-70 factor (ECF subfamily)